MSTITPQSGTANTVLAPQAATASDSLVVGTNQRCVLQVINASGSSINVTLAGGNTCNFGATHTVVVACGVGTTPIEISGLLAQQVVNPTTGNVTITYSSTTSITVAAVTT